MELKFYFQDKKRNMIGEKVRQLRKSSGLSQKELAIKLQVNGVEISDLTVLRIEKGTRLVADFELFALCKYFEITPDEMFDYE